MVKCIVGEFSKDRSRCFNYQNFFLPLEKTGLFYEGPLREGTKWILFIDLPEQAITNLSTVIYWKSLGLKIAYAFYDEARFDTVQQLINLDLCDKLILFDYQYRKSFKISTYISDYFLNEDLFSYSNSRIDALCYIGHLQFNRELPEGTYYLHNYKKDYKELYYELSKFKGGICFATGRDVLGGIIYHNKAKAIEYLMSGIASYSELGINTIHYNKYLNTLDYNKPAKVIDTNEIKLLNRKVIEDFVNQFI